MPAPDVACYIGVEVGAGVAPAVGVAIGSAAVVSAAIGWLMRHLGMWRPPEPPKE